MYKEDDFLQLSGIQHFAYCRRQWALAYIELQWAENVRTIEGKLLHERAHDSSYSEKRGDILVSRGMPVHSSNLGISGECDIVEFHKSDDGVPIIGREGLYRLVPVEYKRGEPKTNDVDKLQLAAQAICLEEMFCCDIQFGYLFYGETRHRHIVEFTHELRQKVLNCFSEMHMLYSRRHTPMVKRNKGCNACSLKNMCLPILQKSKSSKEYIEGAIHEEATEHTLR